MMSPDRVAGLSRRARHAARQREHGAAFLRCDRAERRQQPDLVHRRGRAAAIGADEARAQHAPLTRALVDEATQTHRARRVFARARRHRERTITLERIGGRVTAFAVFVEAVAGKVERAGVDLRAAVVAVERSPLAVCDYSASATMAVP